jgi:hypothetical protein
MFAIVATTPAKLQSDLLDQRRTLTGQIPRVKIYLLEPRYPYDSLEMNPSSCPYSMDTRDEFKKSVNELKRCPSENSSFF